MRALNHRGGQAPILYNTPRFPVKHAIYPEEPRGPPPALSRLSPRSLLKTAEIVVKLCRKVGVAGGTRGVKLWDGETS